MNIIKKFLDDKKEVLKGKIIDEQKERVAEENIKMLYLADFALFLFSLVLFGVSFLQETISEVRFSYGLFFVISILIFLVLKYIVEKRTELLSGMIVICYLVVAAYLIRNNILYFNETPAASLYILMALAFCFIIKPYILIALQVVAGIAFVVSSYIAKPYDIAVLDMAHGLMMVGISCVLGCTVLGFRMRAMEKLEQKEQALIVSQLYQNILDETQTGIVVHDVVSGEIFYGNHKIKEIYGISDEVAELPHDSLLYVERGNKHIGLDMEKLQRGEYIEDVEYHSNSGRYYQVKGKLIDWYGRDAYVEYLTDVTASKKINEQLQTAHNELKRRYQEEMMYRDNSVSEEMIASSRINLTHGFVEEMRVGKQDGFEKEYKYAVDLQSRTKAFANKVWLEPEQIKRMSPDQLLECYTKGQDRVSERYVAELKNGRHVWIRTEVSMVERPDTSEIIAFAYSRNVTKEKMLTHILEKIMSFEYDEIYTIDAMNGYISAVAKGHFALDNQLKEGEYQQELKALMVRAGSEAEKRDIECKLNLEHICRKLEEKQSYEKEFSLISKNGDMRLKQLRFLYLNKQIGAILFTIKDIDDVVREEKEKQEKLEIALQMAEEANVTKTSFLASMSHEIRTPMNAIIGLNEIIREEAANEKQVIDCTEKLDSASKYLLGLLNDILDMSRIESGNVILQHTKFNAAQFWENVNILARAQAKPAGINYVFEMKNTRCKDLVGDATRLQQILVNLINNAVKFTPTGGTVKVEVEENEIVAGRGKYTIKVSDTGIGISPEFLPNVFQAFTQEHDGNTSIYGGSGLGLSIAKNYAHLMDGDITVESNIGQGTTFTVEVWLGMLQDEEDTSNIGKMPDKAELSFEGKKMLLVEDHPLNTMVATRLLEKKKSIVVHAENGQIAVDLFNNSELGEYDAILMDIRMPVMDGIEATKVIRALNRADAKTVPIIAMTANAYDEDRQKTKAAGMNEHLAKPIDPQLLYETLDKYIFGA